MIPKKPLRVLLPALLAAAGCASAGPVKPAAWLERSCEATAVVVSGARPDADLGVFAESRPSGAAAGAGIGAGTGALTGLYLAASTGPFFPVFGPMFAAGGAAAGAVGGAIYGGATALPADTAAGLRKALAAALEGQRPETRLEGTVRRAGENSGCGFAATGDRPGGTAPGAALEVTVERGVLEGGKTLALAIDATLRFVVPDNSAPVPVERISYRGKPHPVDSWLSPDGAFARRELDRGTAELADRIVDRFLLARDLPLFPGPIPGFPPAYCGLHPVFPPARVRVVLPGPNDSPFRVAETAVDSLRPTFRWEPFPGADRAAEMAPFMGRIRDVVYDLDVWKTRDGFREELAYRRRGLTGPFHRIEASLEPGTAYFWTVRSRFLLDGRLRATPWSCSRHPYRDPDPCTAAAIPADNYLRFRTP